MNREPANHSHVCQNCGHEWNCVQGVKCEARKAARIDRLGPFCALCRHLTMLRRHAALRGLALTEVLRYPDVDSTIP